MNEDAIRVVSARREYYGGVLTNLDTKVDSYILERELNTLRLTRTLEEDWNFSAELRQEYIDEAIHEQNRDMRLKPQRVAYSVTDEFTHGVYNQYFNFVEQKGVETARKVLWENKQIRESIWQGTKNGAVRMVASVASMVFAMALFRGRKAIIPTAKSAGIMSFAQLPSSIVQKVKKDYADAFSEEFYSAKTEYLKDLRVDLCYEGFPHPDK